MFNFNKFGLCIALVIVFFLPLKFVFSDQGDVDQEIIELKEINEENVVIKDYNQREADTSAIKIIEKNTLLSKKIRSAFPVGDNFIVTSSLKNPNGEYVIEYKGKEINAIYQTTDSTGRISLFRIPNVDFQVPQISLDPVGSNRQVHIHYYSKDESSKPFNNHGKFQKLINSELYGPDSYLHNLDDFLERESIGAPIFNNCGEIIGMNIRKDNSFSDIPTQYIALGHEAIIKFLNEQGIDFSQSEIKCLSEKEKREFLDEEKIKKEEEAKNVLTGHRLNYMNTWEKLDEMLSKSMGKEFRNKVLDSMLEETDVKFNPEWEKEIDFNGPMVAVFETYTTPFNET